MPTFFECLEDPVPGPGEYQSASLDAVLPSAPSFSISQRYDPPDDPTPGPGSYSIEKADKVVYRALDGIKIKDRHGEPLPPETPGPGTYEVQRATEFKSGGFAFSEKHPDVYEREHQMTPGPGCYNPILSLKLTQDKALPCTFKGSSALLGPFASTGCTPGPSAYFVNDSMTTPRSVSIPIGHKQPLNYDNHVPGPGSYSNVTDAYIKTTQPTAPAFTMHGRPDHGGPFDVHALKDLELVAPGSYTVDKVVSNGGPIYPHAANLSGRHKDLLEREHLLNPGPGDYFSDNEQLPTSQMQMTPRYSSMSAKGCKIGLRSTDTTMILSQPGLGTYANAAVGPGSYTPKSIAPSVPGGSMGAKHKDLQRSLGDGPAKYNIRDAANSTLPSLGRPCMHNGRANNLESPFTTRFNCSCPGGPGTYHLGEQILSSKLRGVRSLIRSDSPRGSPSGKLGSSIGIRYRERRVPNTPGPGEYDICSRSHGPAFSLRSRTALKIGSGASGK